MKVTILKVLLWTLTVVALHDNVQGLPQPDSNDNHKHIKVQRGVMRVSQYTGQNPQAPRLADRNRKNRPPPSEQMVKARPEKKKIGEVTFYGNAVPAANNRPPLPAEAIQQNGDAKLADEVDDDTSDELSNENEGPADQLAGLSLDDILKSPKGQEVIMDEVERRVLARMETVIDEVGEEIVEAMENDAMAAMVENRERNVAHHLRSNPIVWAILTLIKMLTGRIQ